MASAYTPQDGMDLVRKYCSDVPVESISMLACDMIHSEIWRYYPWRWSQSALTPIALVTGTQDYAVTNTNVYRHLRLRLVRTDTTPDEYGDDLEIRDWLPPDLTPRGYKSIQTIGLEPVTSKLRLPSAASLGTGETVQIQGEYQQTPIRITQANLTVKFSWPDAYFGVFVEGLKWKVYEFVKDNRAGTLQATKNGRVVYTGQLGVYMGHLQKLASDEDYGSEQVMVPEISLGAREW